MIRIIKLLFYYILGVVGVLFISVAPAFIQLGELFNVKLYFTLLFAFTKQFLNPEEWVYMYKEKAYPIFEFLWDPFVYSMQILVSAIIIGFLAAFILAFTAHALPKIVLGFIKRILDLLEAVPDLLVAFALQMVAIWFYKSTGILPFNIAALGSDAKIFLAPVLTLAILPAISLFKILLLMIEEELLKDYTEFARSKGIKPRRILLGHVLKNILPSAFYHSKIILWGMFSSLFIIEIVFNIKGITTFATLGYDSMMVAFALLFLFTPFFLLYNLIDFWISAEESNGIPIGKKRSFRLKWTSKGEAVVRTEKIKPYKRSFNPFKSMGSFLKGTVLTLYIHLKNVKFAIGFTFFAVVIGVSLYYHFAHDSHVDQQKFRVNEIGTWVGGPPHPPGEPFLLGSDLFGFDLLDQLIVGAKYTLIVAFLIAFFRVFIGFFFGMIFAFKMKPSQQRWLEKLVDPIHFLPLSVIAYLLLSPVLMLTPMNQYSLSERLIYEIFILTILVLPLTAVLTGNEMKQVLKQEFITSTKVLGGNARHVLRRHVIPHLGPRMTILFGQQFVQVLLVFVHLGVVQLYVGGTILTGGGGFMGPDLPDRSYTNEWSGIIGSAREALYTGNYWVVLWALFAFMLSIIAMQFIIQGVKEVQQVKVGVSYKRIKQKKKKKVVEKTVYTPQPESFTFAMKETE
ncbi:peptide/nickel transport system permease protein [Salirhabdus euzebyi]|uniref:Peptide/nickel transport system permease protein n=1 Tax=Salirhabdus euzebyi TaxID=394506 RepID=A0A841Q6H1_9BACI|nr:ABC transporter permease subunit [Salirhabdus euzebyi]MBB6453902.1 peptide/nickel transport system permease protein [Salirhabdus euzebyi]